MIWTKFKGSALQLTLFIMVVVALLLASFVLLVHIHKRFNLQTDFTVETIQNADFGINYALNNPIRLNDTISINLVDEDYKGLKVHRDFWGLFERVTSKSNVKNKVFYRMALIGGGQPKTNPTALYLQNNNKPLVLVGKTRIEGIAFLPRRGVKTGTISGQSYYGTQLVYGPTRTASVFPKLLSETKNQIKILDKTIDGLNQNQYLELRSGSSFKNSFFKPLQYVLNSKAITLQNIELVGHIVVQSKTKIIVDASAKLKDVILIAPHIEMRNNIKGSFQCFATKSIKVGNNCMLDYPSALVLSEKETITSEPENPDTTDQNGIITEDNSTIKGVVVYLGQPKTNNYKSQVVLESNSQVLGEVYCSQNLELKGTVLGSVFTSNFIANQFGSVYQNYLYNASINANGLSNNYVGLTFNKTKQKGVIKWLY